ncbi:hypothetical protein Bmayo_05100 (plasmid) [Borreliella mayonii]|uniref:Uncharacterized protein n=1 Tax=Borreliella mayonii TaxID=1674146 RepID=A0AAC9KY78_9SPIR|nr:hypothetical protein [Borreliella mayonii]APS99243.1 hypothetical protein A7X70_05420 [Borreliella mayonii]APT00369.1 hypothetical protein Bmayo_05100 [Borreliella mayonii]
MKVIILLFFLLISNSFIFSSETSEKVVILNDSNRYDFGLILKLKTQFGSFILRHYHEGYIDLDFEIQIKNSTEIVFKKVYINGVSVIDHPINARSRFIDEVNYFNFEMRFFEHSEKMNKIRKLAEESGIDVYVECFDEINNKKKKYSFKVSRKNSVHFYSAFDMIFHK